MTEAIQTYEVVWQEIPVTITFEKKSWLPDLAHLQLRAGERLPVTETGYKSLFLSAEAVTEAGGAVAFVEGLLEEAAQSPAWKDYCQERQQLTLF
jgi:hypothetical protein